MRSTWCLAILAAAVVLVGGHRLSICGAAGAGASRKAAPKAPAKSRPAPKDADVVDGYGPTEEKALDRALEHAQLRVIELVRQELGDPSWEPTAGLLELERWGVVENLGKPQPADDVDGDKALRARYKVQLTRKYLDAVLAQAHQVRVQERHGLLARVLGGMLAVLLVTTGYLRLEEMTRGYYTKLLRLAAFGLLALAGLALLLTWA